MSNKGRTGGSNFSWKPNQAGMSRSCTHSFKCWLFPTNLERLRACLLSLEWERLLWLPLELWESPPGHNFCDGLCRQEGKHHPISDCSTSQSYSQQQESQLDTCVWNGTFSCGILSVNESVTASETGVAFETDWRNASLFLLKRESQHREGKQLQKLKHATKRKNRPGSMAAAMVDWASLTLFITFSNSLAAACGVSSGGFTMALLEWFTLKDKWCQHRVHTPL